MDNIEMVDEIESGVDIESRGVDISPEPLLSRLPTNERAAKGDAEKERKWNPLLDALLLGDWKAIKHILDEHPEAIYDAVGNEETPLHFAIRNHANVTIIERLINLMTLDKLASSSVLHVAATSSNLPAAKLLIQKQPALLNNGRDNEIYALIHLAVRNQLKEMAFYLLNLSSGNQNVESHRTGTDNIDLMECAIKSGMYDFAMVLLQKNPKLAWDTSPWEMLIEKCDDFLCRKPLSIWQSFIYSRIHVDFVTIEENFRTEWKKAKNYLRHPGSEAQSQKHKSSGVYKFVLRKQAREFLEWLVPSIKDVRVLKLKHYEALQLVKSLCVEITKKFDEKQRSNIVSPVFSSAVQNGMSNIVQQILQKFPNIIKEVVDDKNNALQFAALHRDGQMFQVLHEGIGRNEKLLESKDDEDNNILHLVAKRPMRKRLESGSEEVLQMQREFQWYKKMTTLLPSKLILQKNMGNKAPLEVFDEEHQDMLESENLWLTSMANSCMVAGSLIAAVVFAAAITVPGGDNDDGVPKFSNRTSFQVFAVSDGCALILSLTTVVTFLSIFTTRYSAESFLYVLPIRLMIGLTSLLLSVAFLMIAFSATIYLFFADAHKWIIYPTVAASCIPVLLVSCLQMPSLYDIMVSTYRHNIFKEDNVTFLGVKK